MPAETHLLMAVTFERHGQLHYLAATETFTVGDWVLYPTDAGPEVAQVVWAPEHHVEAGQFPRCPGRASQADLDRDARMRQARAEALLVARRLVAEHQLSMKVLAVDVVGEEDAREVAIYYTAPERVDFRALVPDLARSLQARVDLRQIGARDAAQVSGGVGHCGRELCCSTFLKKVEPVPLRLAKAQGLPPNPLQISGACGKLMCCLTYEHPLYVDFSRRAPAIGERVTTPEGGGIVVGHQVPAQEVVVRDQEGQLRRCPLVEVCTSHRARKERTASLKRRRQTEQG